MTERAKLDSEALAREIAAVCDEKKASGIVALDMRSLVGYTDFLVICTARSDRQTRAIQDGIREELKKRHGLLPGRVEGEREATWILMDYLDAILHIFGTEAREHYRLEALWGEAPKLDLGLDAAASA